MGAVLGWAAPAFPMFLKNYTSEVPVSQTIHRIEQVLIRCGASGIAKEFVGTDGKIAAVAFQIEAPNQWNRRKAKRRQDFAEQAARTAWKIVQDWVEVQMSMIQLRQADTLQVFLPYVWNGRETYYQSLKGHAFKGLLPETCAA